MRPNPLETADSVTFTDETLTVKLHYFCDNISWRLEEIVRQRIQESLYELSWSEVSVKLLQGAVSLTILKSCVRVNTENVVIYP